MKRLDRWLCELLSPRTRAENHCVVFTKLRGHWRGIIRSKPEGAWPHKCPNVVSFTRARDGKLCRPRLHFRAEPLLSRFHDKDIMQHGDIPAFQAVDPTRSRDGCGASGGSSTAAALSLTLAMPATRKAGSPWSATRRSKHC
jgi:hypothetical protein